MQVNTYNVKLILTLLSLFNKCLIINIQQLITKTLLHDSFFMIISSFALVVYIS